MIIRVSRLLGGIYPCIITIDDRDIEAAQGRIAVYGLRDPRSSQIYYIGSAEDLVRRMRGHCVVRSPRSPLERRKMEINQANLFTEVIVLAFADDRAEADRLEHHYINRYQATLLNVKIHKWRKEDV